MAMKFTKKVARGARWVRVTAIGLMVSAMCAMPAAAQDLASAANKWKDAGVSFGGLAWIFIAVVGFVVAAVGIMKVINAKKTNEGMGVGVGMLLGGAIMCALPILINATSQQTFGQNASGLEQIDVE